MNFFRIKARYPIGIIILSVTGILGGDIFMTSIEIGIMYALLDWITNDHNTPRGT
jgi:hypothetical protein